MDETEFTVEYTDVVAQRAIVLTKLGLAMNSMFDDEARSLALAMMDKLVKSISLPPQAELIVFPTVEPSKTKVEPKFDIGEPL